MSSARRDVESVLLESLPELVLRPGDSAYGESNASYFSAFEIELQPSFIITPRTTTHVCELLQALREKLLPGQVQVAIRGTGHTPFAGSANIEAGVTVDMRGFKGIKINKDYSTAIKTNEDDSTITEINENDSTATVDIAVGETWSTVYSELSKHGLTTAGGRVGRVGVAGFVLGGGLSMFSSRYGFACDSVLDFEIVLASGEVIHANERDHHDLWVSLKGCLNNFGCVTSIKMKTFPSHKIWGGLTYYSPETFVRLLQKSR